MTRRTRTQRAWDAARDVISALALTLLGLALTSGDLSIGTPTISQSLGGGVALMGAGVALMVAGVLFGTTALMRDRHRSSGQQA